MTTIRKEMHDRTSPAREALLDRAFGEPASPRRPNACAKAACRPAGCRSSPIERQPRRRHCPALARLAGPARPALLLGPLAVDDAWRGLGIGAALMRRATEAAHRLGHKAVLLVGDAPYYGRFGFTAEKTGALWMPGPYERDACSRASWCPARSTARAA